MATNNAANYSPTQYSVLSGGANGAINNISPSTAGYVLTSNGASSQPTFQAASSTMASLLDTQAFSSNGTWTKPGSGSYCNALIISGGGGGGSGRQGATSSTREGGTGGDSGYALWVMGIPLSVLSATESVTVGTGGTGGTGQTVASTNGNAGTNGNPSIFSNWRVPGGAGGRGGATNTGNGDDGSISTMLVGNYEPNTFFQLLKSDSISSSFLSSSPLNFTQSIPGQGGSSINTSNSLQQPTNITFNFAFNAATYAWITGNPGNNGTAILTYFGGGGGGGNGNAAGTISAAGGNGINGGGGGAGAATTNGTTSGAGGNGGNGYVVIFTYG